VKFPDVAELLILRGAARRLSLRTHGTARALLLGSYRSSHRGRGLEFEEVRPYVAGDDPRSIDWRVTARRGRVHTKLFREERERPVWLLVDLNPSMFFGSRTQLKSMAAVRAAALLAWVAALGADRVGAVIGGAPSIRVLAPRSREAGVLPILNALVELQPREPCAAPTRSLHRALQALMPLVHPGSLVLALSDFAELDEADRILWSTVAAHSECRWIFISDPLERQGLPAGRFRAGDSRHAVSLDGARVRPDWLRAWQARQSRTSSYAESLRIELLPLDTVQSVAETMASSMGLAKPAA
jgi:uncharacterized protein (DUF58 family)